MIDCHTRNVIRSAQRLSASIDAPPWLRRPASGRMYALAEWSARNRTRSRSSREALDAFRHQSRSGICKQLQDSPLPSIMGSRDNARMHRTTGLCSDPKRSSGWKDSAPCCRMYPSGFRTRTAYAANQTTHASATSRRSPVRQRDLPAAGSSRGSRAHCREVQFVWPSQWFLANEAFNPSCVPLYIPTL